MRVYIDLDSKKGKQHQGQEETNKGKDKKIASTTEKRRDPKWNCNNYDVDGNIDEKFWKLHPELHPKWMKTKEKKKTTTKTKEEVVESTSDLDKAIICSTLQQPRASGDKHALV